MASTSCAFSVTARPRATNKSTARGKRVVRARAADAEAAPAVDVSSTEVRSLATPLRHRFRARDANDARERARNAAETRMRSRRVAGVDDAARAIGGAMKETRICESYP